MAAVLRGDVDGYMYTFTDDILNTNTYWYINTFTIAAVLRGVIDDIYVHIYMHICIYVYIKITYYILYTYNM